MAVGRWGRWNSDRKSQPGVLKQLEDKDTAQLKSCINIFKEFVPEGACTVFPATGKGCVPTVLCVASNLKVVIERGHPSQNLSRAFAVRIQLCELPDLAFDEEPQREFGTRGRRKRGLESWELVWGRRGGGG